MPNNLLYSQDDGQNDRSSSSTDKQTSGSSGGDAGNDPEKNDHDSSIKTGAKLALQSTLGKEVKDRIKKSIEKLLVNKTSQAILKNGYYEVNGFKFTEFYFKKLWGRGGRPAPSLVAKSILDNATKIISDPQGYAGFFKYFYDGWEMVYNPTTKIVSHIQPIR